MAHKEKIDYLLLSLRELEKLIAGMRDMEIYPASFFSQCFSLSHRIFRDLHCLETEQLEELGRQMEEHRRLIESIPRREISPQPVETSQWEEAAVSREEPAIELPLELPEEPVSEVAAEIPEVPSIERPIIAPSSADISETADTSQTVDVSQRIVEPVEPADPVVGTPPSAPLSPADRPEITESIPSAPVAPGADSRETPMARTRPLVSPQLTIGEKPAISLNEVLEKKNLSDFRKAFSLNDRFRFRRELFGGDEEKMNRAIRDLNELHTFEDSITYLHNELQWNVDDAAVADFIQLLEKRFS